MYYPLYGKSHVSSRTLTAIVVISIFSLLKVFPICAAELLNVTSDEYRSQGYAAQQKGNFDQALTYYTKAESLGDRSPNLYNDIGVVYEELGIVDRAIGSYLQAISIDPNYLPPYTNLAYLYKNQGNTTEAVKYFKERYERAPADDPKREKIRREIFALDPAYKDTLISSELETTSLVLEQKERDDFSQDVARAERHLEQARKYMAEKNYEKAQVEFGRALAMTPNNPKIIREKQQAEYEQNIEAVRAKADVALKKMESGDVEAARTEFQNILAIIPKEPAQKPE